MDRFQFTTARKRSIYRKGYLFTGSTPLYPFGYGLSYTSFEYSDLELSDTSLPPNGEITASIEVRNPGQTAGSEVVQLYIKDIIGSVLRPDNELKGFEKVNLEPGEPRAVFFAISPGMLALSGLDIEAVIESGEYVVMVGGSSADHLKVDLTLRVAD